MPDKKSSPDSQVKYPSLPELTLRIQCISWIKSRSYFLILHSGCSNFYGSTSFL